MSEELSISQENIAASENWEDFTAQLIEADIVPSFEDGLLNFYGENKDSRLSLKRDSNGKIIYIELTGCVLPQISNNQTLGDLKIDFTKNVPLSPTYYDPARLMILPYESAANPDYTPPYISDPDKLQQYKTLFAQYIANATYANNMQLWKVVGYDFAKNPIHEARTPKGIIVSTQSKMEWYPDDARGLPITFTSKYNEKHEFYIYTAIGYSFRAYGNGTILEAFCADITPGEIVLENNFDDSFFSDIDFSGLD